MTTNDKPAPQPDGWCAHNWRKYLHQKGEMIEVESDNSRYSCPVYLISPQQKARMEALEKLAESIRLYLDCVERKWEADMGQEEEYLRDLLSNLPKAE